MKLEPKPLSRRAMGLFAVAAAASLAGCIVVPRPHGGAYPQQYPSQYPSQQPAPQQQGPYEANVPPPPPRDEVYGVPPVVGWIWLGGYWSWQLGRHVWIGGRWSAPQHGHRWVPHRWERHGNGWRMHEGHWAKH